MSRHWILVHMHTVHVLQEIANSISNSKLDSDIHSDQRKSFTFEYPGSTFHFFRLSNVLRTTAGQYQEHSKVNNDW